MKHIKTFENFDFGLSDGNLIPDDTIDIFCKRIKSKIDDGADSEDHPSIQRELNNIKKLNDNKIPAKIQVLLAQLKK